MKNLFNKHRPNTFESMIAKNSSLNYLRKAIANKSILNAYILSGPFGNGKTTLARIMCKAFNCSHFAAYEDICNVCSECIQSSYEGTEIDAASRRGINEIKEIVERFMPLPIFCRFRTIILDEAHMLTNDAFGFLLKILEEPPLHMIFILVTTEYDKLPNTIKSRCSTIYLPSYENESIRKALKYICQKENITISEATYSFICRRSNGSMRNALNLLEQMQFVTDAPDIMVNFETNENLLNVHSMMSGDWNILLSFIENISSQGMQSASFFRSFLNFVVEKKMLYYNYILEAYFELMPYEESCAGEKFFWIHLLNKIWKIFHK